MLPLSPRHRRVRRGGSAVASTSISMKGFLRSKRVGKQLSCASDYALHYGRLFNRTVKDCAKMVVIVGTSETLNSGDLSKSRSPKDGLMLYLACCTALHNHPSLAFW